MPSERLTADQVAEIRQRRAAGESRGVLSLAYGVSCWQISAITGGRAWKQGAIKDRRREGNSNWRGGRRISPKGYVCVLAPDHPRQRMGYVYEHILVAERALGKTLAAKHPIHHHNEDKTDNRPGNLVICESLSYHRLLHERMRALRAPSNQPQER